MQSEGWRAFLCSWILGIHPLVQNEWLEENRPRRAHFIPAYSPGIRSSVTSRAPWSHWADVTQPNVWKCAVLERKHGSAHHTVLLTWLWNSFWTLHFPAPWACYWEGCQQPELNVGRAVLVWVQESSVCLRQRFNLVFGTHLVVFALGKLCPHCSKNQMGTTWIADSNDNLIQPYFFGTLAQDEGSNQRLCCSQQLLLYQCWSVLNLRTEWSKRMTWCLPPPCFSSVSSVHIR